jgi:tetratricopeptide (TPR) repeat protein
MKLKMILLLASASLHGVNYIADIDTTCTKPLKQKKYQDYVAEGKELQSKEQLDKALQSYQQALTLRPKEYQSCIELGNCLLTLGNKFFDLHQSENALTAFKAILEISSEIPAVHHNIAFTMAEQTGEFAQAIKHYQKALDGNPNNIETHFCYSLALLALGKLPEGFTEYESRWKRYKHAPRTFKNYPLENQLMNLEVAGKRVFIRVEQGLGDTLHFIRYAQLLKSRGAIVIAEIQTPLANILALCPYLDEIVAIGSPTPPFDYQIPMLNLPILFKTTIDSVPCQSPYLRADPLLIAYWRQQLANDANFKIGICWRGDPTHGQSKFMPFNYFSQLAQLPGVTVYSLQKYDASLENNPALQAQGTMIKQFDEDFDNSHGRFMDTAAVMKNLDLIITVDTSIAHLAGGLGVPTWLVLPFPAEWRWLTERTDSPWYPSMKLVRQNQFGDWHSVYNHIVVELEKKISEKK